MDIISQLDWAPRLLDPIGQRSSKPRTTGRTMVIDKGLGLHAFADLLELASEHIDLIKIGFGTPSLYPPNVLRKKIALSRQYGIEIMPGGTFLEVAVMKDEIRSYFEAIQDIGFTALEVSDGTISMDRVTRNDLMKEGLDYGLKVYTEYGKKAWGSKIELDCLIETIHTDLENGAELVTIEGRESGVGVGIFDDSGDCKVDEIDMLIRQIPSPKKLLWEAPLKQQQVQLMKKLGLDLNLGNIAPDDVLSLEALRRGLRSDTICPS